MPRTRTGLLETHLENVQAVESLCRHRQHAPQALVGDERAIVENMVRLTVGLQRLLRRWIALRTTSEREPSIAVRSAIGHSHSR